MTSLLRRSVEIILENQNARGAYVASPSFSTYRYCWFRDGSFIAHAMDLAGEVGSARRFHEWASGVVNARAEVVRRAVASAGRGEPLAPSDYLHTRFSVDGLEDTEGDWPNYQLDGFGAWLWALEGHCRVEKEPVPAEWGRAADLVADYLGALWSRPCYDCWEEFPSEIHPYTLAAIYAGLQSHARLRGGDHRPAMETILRVLRGQAVAEGHFVKCLGTQEVDASLLGLATPFAVIQPEDPVMQATVSRIEADLRFGGGVHRYARDTYYGGGEWILLTAWLGWHYACLGEREKAQEMMMWVEAQADAAGQLPEQVPASLNQPESYDLWRTRWGDIARPLLWSHAKYIILHSALDSTSASSATDTATVAPTETPSPTPPECSPP